MVPGALPQTGHAGPCAVEGIHTDAPARLNDPVLGRFWVRETDSDEIAWVDPVTLRRAGENRAALPEQTGLWAVSPDGRLLAVALRRGVHIIDTDGLNSITTAPMNPGPVALGWVSDTLLGAVTDSAATLWSAHKESVQSLALPPSEGVVAWRGAPGRLLAPLSQDGRGDAGSARLLEISAAGIETIELDGLRVGFDPDLGRHGTMLTPGLAYDPVGHRVFVVPPSGRVAEIELTGETVSYHSVGTSLLHGVVAALVPSASAKLSSWATIEAAWLGGGLMAVSGYGGDAATGEGEAAGVKIIDTRDWSACLLDQGATRIAFTGRTLLAWGGGNFGEHGGVGLAGYDLASDRRWHVFGRQYLDVQVAGPYAYAVNSWNGWHVSTVEVSTGHIIARGDRRPPTVLPTESFIKSW